MKFIFNFTHVRTHTRAMCHTPGDMKYLARARWVYKEGLRQRSMGQGWRAGLCPRSRPRPGRARGSEAPLGDKASQKTELCRESQQALRVQRTETGFSPLQPPHLAQLTVVTTAGTQHVLPGHVLRCWSPVQPHSSNTLSCQRLPLKRLSSQLGRKK
uniref:Uncharacterized protein n=1 Tax=Rousettus aegyptiacus TaxID=9407 RepID=A0A7J8CIW6_ROUAE|nr:hypothetical protein HJG63_009252 [Rousettus aegyptiacus]